MIIFVDRGEKYFKVVSVDVQSFQDFSKFSIVVKAVQEFSKEIGQNFFLLDSGNVFFVKR